jgi:hypothetical protein
LVNGTSAELWTGKQAHVFGGPAISPDGHSIAFSVSQYGRTLLYVMQADGTNAHTVSESLELQGSPGWTPDGQSITSAVVDHGAPVVCPGLCGRSCVGPRRTLCCLYWTRRRYDVFRKSRHSRGRAASPAHLDPDSRRPALGLPPWKWVARCAARRDST